MYAVEYRFENVAKLCLIFRNVIQSLWVWGKIVAPKGIHCEKQREIILEMSKLGCKFQIPWLIGCCFCICGNGFIFFFRRPIHNVITLNGLTTRNLIFKGKKKRVKPVVEKELMVGKKVKKMKFLWKGRKLCLIWWRKMRSWRWNCNKRKKLGHSCFFYLWYRGSQQL